MILRTLGTTAAWLFAFALPSAARDAPAPPQHTDESIAAWAASYAPDCQPATHHCSTTSNLIWDPHFTTLITHSLTREQSWWVDGHAGSASVLSLARAFLGIPDAKTQFDSNRYLTVSGCVPHSCTSKGMLWVDSSPHPAVVALVAEDIDPSAPHEQSGNYHLWIYWSGALNQPIPQPFLASLRQWHDQTSAAAESDLPQTIAMVTLVAHDGRTRDLTFQGLVGDMQPDPSGASK